MGQRCFGSWLGKISLNRTLEISPLAGSCKRKGFISKDLRFFEVILTLSASRRWSKLRRQGRFPKIPFECRNQFWFCIFTSGSWESWEQTVLVLEVARMLQQKLLRCSSCATNGFLAFPFFVLGGKLLVKGGFLISVNALFWWWNGVGCAVHCGCAVDDDWRLLLTFDLLGVNVEVSDYSWYSFPFSFRICWVVAFRFWRTLGIVVRFTITWSKLYYFFRDF